jgi:hypothetical protein
MADDLRFNIDPGKVPELMETLMSHVGLKRGLLSAGLHLKARIDKYPPPSRRPQGFVSDVQRRGFFARLRAGDIEVPYQRGMSPTSERLAQRWAVVESDIDLAVTVGNNASYAGLVQGSKQTLYHKQTGWRKAEDVAKDEFNTMQEIVVHEIDQSVKDIR